MGGTGSTTAANGWIDPGSIAPLDFHEFWCAIFTKFDTGITGTAALWIYHGCGWWAVRSAAQPCIYPGGDRRASRSAENEVGSRPAAALAVGEGAVGRGAFAPETFVTSRPGNRIATVGYVDNCSLVTCLLVAKGWSALQKIKIL